MKNMDWDLVVLYTFGLCLVGFGCLVGYQVAVYGWPV